jgi:hypothetical protein
VKGQNQYLSASFVCVACLMSLCDPTDFPELADDLRVPATRLCHIGRALVR